MSEPSTPGPRARGNWLRFRLRTLLIVAPLLAIGAAIAFRFWYVGYLEKRAVLEVERLGGAVVRNEAGEVTGVELPGAGIDDEKLRRLVPHLANLRRLETLVLVSNSVTDEGLMLLAQVPNLQTLFLADTQATDQGIAKLQGLRPNLLIDRRNPHVRALRLARRPVFEHAILSLAAAPGGGKILAGSGDGRVQLFDLASDERSMTLRAHEEWAFAIAFHPDGKRFATGGGDGLVKLWSWPALEEVGRFVGHHDDVHAIGFTPDGRTLVSTGDDMTVRVWDVETQHERHCLTGHTGTIPGLAIGPDGQIAASASRDDTIRLWDITSGKPIAVLEGHAGDIMAVDFHPLGRELVSGSYDGTAIVWDIAARTPIRTLSGHADWVFSVGYSPAGEQIVSTAGDGVRLWERASGELIWRSAHPKNASHALWLNPQELAASSADGSIAVFSASRGENVVTLWTQFAPDLVDGGRMAAE